MTTKNKRRTAEGSPKRQVPRCFVRMFKPQFAPLVEAGTKLQTVRPTPKRVPKTGDRISLRSWTGRPYASKQRVLRESEIVRVDRFSIENGTFGRVAFLNDIPMEDEEIDAFAKADGFSGASEFVAWFDAEHGPNFEGIVIHWRNVKLTDGGETETKL